MKRFLNTWEGKGLGVWAALAFECQLYGGVSMCWRGLVKEQRLQGRRLLAAADRSGVLLFKEVYAEVPSGLACAPSRLPPCA